MREHMHQWLNAMYLKNWDDKEDPKEEGVVLEIWGSKMKNLIWIFKNEACKKKFLGEYLYNGSMDLVSILTIYYFFFFFCNM